MNKATVLGYRVNDQAVPVYTFAYEDKDLDMAYFEKMMAVADADNDGKNELVISTRGDNQSEKITSEHLGYVFLYKIDAMKNIHKTLLVDFNNKIAESSWLAVGDADNDGKNEIVLATGKGDRTKKGTSYVVIVKKKDEWKFLLRPKLYLGWNDLSEASLQTNADSIYFNKYLLLSILEAQLLRLLFHPK